METTIVYSGYIGDNGKENGNYPVGCRAYGYNQPLYSPYINLI